MALGPNERRREYDECEPWDIGEWHYRMAVSPGGYEEKDSHGKRHEEQSEERRRPQKPDDREEYTA